MTSLVIFLLKSSLSLSLLYLFYLVFLQKETFLTFNRIYLLMIPFLAILLPLCVIPLPAALSDVSLSHFSFEQVFSSSEIFSQEIKSIHNNYKEAVPFSPINSILMSIYLSGTGIMMFLFTSRLLRIHQLLKAHPTHVTNQIQIIDIDQEVPPFSFLNFIFINKKKYRKKDLNQIIAHECIHVRKYHSYDLIVLESYKIIFWFNPITWALIRSLRRIHEFQADRGVIKHGFDKTKYQFLLLRQTINNNHFSWANTFGKPQIKRRLDMLNKENSNNFKRLKVLFLIPLFLVLFIFFNIPSTALKASLLIEKNIEFKLPLKQGRLTSGFGVHINPFTQKEVFHHAIDIASPQGTPVYAAAQGFVVVTDSIKGHGNRIILQHVQGFTTYYSHLYKILVDENQVVNAGDKIGLVGNTGLSTAPHLHFEIRNGKDALNPADFLDLAIYNKK